MVNKKAKDLKVMNIKNIVSDKDLKIMKNMNSIIYKMQNAKTKKEKLTGLPLTQKEVKKAGVEFKNALADKLRAHSQYNSPNDFLKRMFVAQLRVTINRLQQKKQMKKDRRTRKK